MKGDGRRGGTGDRGARAFRVLLHLYPRGYRRRYAREMEDFFLEERRAAGGGPRFWLRLVADHMEAAWAVRRRESRRGMGMMGQMVENLRSAWRTLMRAPTFTLFAVATLALGIGATTSVFSVLDRILIRPLPYPGSERMMMVGIEARIDPGELGPLSVPLAARLSEAPGPAESIVAAYTTGVAVHDTGYPERVGADQITRGFFEFFGARPEAGRLLVDADYDNGAPKVVVMGHGLWTNRYGADPEVVGSSLRLDDEVYTVVGVVSRDFILPTEIAGSGEFWVPYPLSLEDAESGSFFLSGIARLRPGTTQADLNAYMGQVIEELYPPADEGPNFLQGGAVRNYRDVVVGPVGQTLPRVMAAVALLLLIACVNVAGLLLTRGAQRAHEMAVRAALGAGRARMVGQLLWESALMALAGGVVGAGLAWGAVELFRTYAPAGLPRLAEVAVDGRGLAFSVALALATVVLFGLLPALRSAGTAGPGAEGLARRTTASRREGRLRGALISVETALAVVLAVGSSLLARDLIRLAGEDTGFRTEGMAAMTLDIRAQYERDAWVSTWGQILDGAQTLPGVTSAALANQAPLGGTNLASTFRPEGWEDSGGEFVIQAIVAGDYVETLGARMVEGRALGPTDDGTSNVAVVNEAFVKEYWPDHSQAASGGQSAVGKLIHSGSTEELDEPSLEVVGVMADVRTRVGRDVTPHIFVPLAGNPWWRMNVLVRTEGEAAALADPLRALVRRIDPTLAVWRITTVEGLAQEGLSRPRFYTGLFGGFAVVALLLALVGVYGTTAYATRTRVREIGIRMALGAQRASVVRRVVGRTAAVVGVGVALGLAGAGVGSRAMTDVLTYVTPHDVAAYAAVALVMLGAGVMAAWIPAGRAGRVDPATTLREEG